MNKVSIWYPIHLSKWIDAETPILSKKQLLKRKENSSLVLHSSIQILFKNVTILFKTKTEQALFTFNW